MIGGADTHHHPSFCSTCCHCHAVLFCIFLRSPGAYSYGSGNQWQFNTTGGRFLYQEFIHGTSRLWPNCVLKSIKCVVRSKSKFQYSVLHDAKNLLLSTEGPSISHYFQRVVEDVECPRDSVTPKSATALRTLLIDPHQTCRHSKSSTSYQAPPVFVVGGWYPPIKRWVRKSTAGAPPHLMQPS